MNQKSQNQSHNNAKPGPRGLTVDVTLYIETTNHTAHNTSACQLQQDGNVDQGAPQYSYKATSVRNIARGIWKAMVLLGTAELIQNYTWVPDFN